MIYFNNVSKIYNGQNKNIEVLNGISLTIKRGDFIVISGKSGSGKTTLLKMILAHENPTSGTIFFESQNIHTLKRADLIKLRRKIGIIFQDFKLLSKKTVYENIELILEMFGKSNKEFPGEILNILELFGLKNKILNFPHQISFGEQQRLAIARALAVHPEIIIADEPFSGLDYINAAEVLKIFKNMNSSGATVILVSNNEIINNIKADNIKDDIIKKQRTIILENGKIFENNVLQG